MQGEILHGPYQFSSGDVPKSQIPEGIDLKPEANRELEKLIDETVLRVAGTDKALCASLMRALDGHEPAVGQNINTLSEAGIDAMGTAFTLRERLAAAAIEQDPDDVLTRKENLEDLITGWASHVRARGNGRN